MRVWVLETTVGFSVFFLPVALFGGKKDSSFHWHEIHELNLLSEHNSNGSSSFLLAVTSSEVRIRTRYAIYPPFQIWNIVLSSIQSDQFRSICPEFRSICFKFRSVCSEFRCICSEFRSICFKSVYSKFRFVFKFKSVLQSYLFESPRSV